MKNTHFFGSLRSRKFRHGGYATLLILAGLAVVVAANLLVDQVPGKLDLTQNRLYSLSAETYRLLDGLQADVTITQLSRVGSEDPTIKTILGKYSARNQRIKVDTVDPERNPAWVKQYDTAGQGLGSGALVVAAGAKYKTIGVYDMYNFDYSDPNSQPQLTSLSVEQRVTSALQYVTAERNVTLYSLTGHGEAPLETFSLTSTVSNGNYATKDLNLLTAPAVPSDADILLVLAPRNDLSAEEAEKVRAYLAQGGRAAFLIDLSARLDPLPRFDDLLKSYGVAMRNATVIEGDANRVAFSNPLFMLPTLESHDILSPLRAQNLPVVVYYSQYIETLELRKKNLRIEPLLSSSAESFARADLKSNQSAQKVPGDVSGPLSLAVAITDPASESLKKDTKLVVVASAGFLAPSLTAQVPGNTDFFMNSIGWLKDQKDSISVRPKSLQQMRLSISSFQALLLSGAVVILLPLLILGAGVWIWIRRRHL